MGKHRLKLRELRKILRSFGIEEDPSRGHGGHTMFFQHCENGTFSYPVLTDRNVLPCYVKGCRKKFLLLPKDGVADEDFFGRA